MNIRGFGKSGHRTQLKDYIHKEKIDAIFLQEMMHQDFTGQELWKLVNGELFHWHWRPAEGISGECLWV
jgi:hypothetical protein